MSPSLQKAVDRIHAVIEAAAGGSDTFGDSYSNNAYVDADGNEIIVQELPTFVRHINGTIAIGVVADKSLIERVNLNFGLVGRYYHIHEAKELGREMNGHDFYFPVYYDKEFGLNARLGLDFAITRDKRHNLAVSFEQKVLGQIDFSRVQIGYKVKY